LRRLLKKNPTEIDLELATIEQILKELHSRPMSYLILLPKFYVDEENKEFALSALLIHGSGVPDYAAAGICEAASKMIGKTGEFKEEANHDD
jgi:hypothetical protein